MATNHRRIVWRDSSHPFFVARVEATRDAIARRSHMVVVPDDGRLRDGQTETSLPTGGAGQTDRGLATRFRPGRWDRFLSRVARHRAPSPALRAADDTLTASLDRYNRVRTYQGREPLRRTDLGLDEITHELTREDTR